MKLSRIKKACMDEGIIRLYTAEQTCNNVIQWLGTDKALYAVEGCVLTLTTLQAIWEIEPKKAANLDMAEDTLRGAVERRMLTDRDADILAGAPGMIDSLTAPPLTMAAINDFRAMLYGDSRVMFVPEDRFVPCYGKHSLTMDVHSDEETGAPAWIAVYADEKLCGMVRPVGQIEAGRLWAIAKAVCQREAVGYTQESSESR